jgi:hypothetical protein
MLDLDGALQCDASAAASIRDMLMSVRGSKALSVLDLQVQEMETTRIPSSKP